ncbi:histidine phosphatase family protein [Novosphingobium sp. Leaf2]|uniref:histidine phosphatase family protein n=1 Tax=Novosphingobium sp. Leaf2 TaxID=1735670 RepID=UPI0006F4D80F|nr:histidine phosphatase family protein [Novosphingobium sp. Leaf2]KQM18271.1 phosphoglycerate mutase [Novosphingobium sp. Leaf2]
MTAAAPVPAFVIVRHGNTFASGETPRRIGARTDLPLTPAGEAQAQALGRHFSQVGWHFTKVLASPLLRTRATAQAIINRQPTPVMPEPCEWLREIDHGVDENQPEDAVIRRIGADALAAWDAHGIAPPGWTVDAPGRLAGWRALFAAHQADCPVLLVTSNGAARFALLADPALSTAMASLASLKLPTGGYGLITRQPDGTLAVPVWGTRP